ncbi:tetratricopeptide repeat protein [Bradyrhizobium jicamae]|uniref:tetratricopeptide repeat protein n=1 Tax=Bradyrhizobium jicamae TaxID=280332 RepID=UPI001FD8B29C|nr:tetratricopeptide repeat protein [Bradyrhizobium jicamae]
MKTRTSGPRFVFERRQVGSNVVVRAPPSASFCKGRGDRRRHPENVGWQSPRPRCGYFGRCILRSGRLRITASNPKVFRCMAVTDCNASSRASRLTAASVALLATVFALPLGGCSFDLGSWGSDKEKPQVLEQKPTGTISGQSVSDAQGHAARGQALVKAGKTEEALAEFDRALALDPYNVPALYGRGLIHQGEAARAGDRGFHRGQWSDAATGRAAAGACHQLPRDRQGQGSRFRSRRGGADRSQQCASLVGPWRHL